MSVSRSGQFLKYLITMNSGWQLMSTIAF
ncbi:uncharacterized protein METZ01_LOCUS316176 [marine metagenome]|uniref:Uncharacterized protein n=1 Tax=marine metagenome TaxID=408172 RepID=A0A382NUE6_9ZZZZ